MRLKKCPTLRFTFVVIAHGMVRYEAGKNYEKQNQAF